MKMNTKKGNTQKIQTKGTKKCLQKEEKHLIMIKKKILYRHRNGMCYHSVATQGSRESS